jgi:small redox-active disulfide protein 2
MKTIQVLGTGCTKCKNLTANVEQAIRDSGSEAQVIKVQDIAEMLTFDGVRGLPALAVDGVVKFCGRVPSVDEIKGLLG